MFSIIILQKKPNLDSLTNRVKEIEQELIKVMKSGWISKGPRTIEFENQLKEFLGVEFAIALNSCTAALHLALVCNNIGPGDEVLLPTLTFTSTANVVEHVGAKPVFVDVNEDDLCIDVTKIESKIRAVRSQAD